MRLLFNIRHSIQARIFLALALITLIFIPGTGYFSYFQARRAVENHMRLYAISTAYEIAERIRNFLCQYMDTARLIKAFMEKGMIDIDDQIELINYFNLLKRDHPEFVNIYFGDQHGHFTMVPPQPPDMHKIFDPRIRPWYRGAQKEGDVNWTRVYLFASNQAPGITASVPIYDLEGDLQGVCGIDIDISTFSRFLQSIKLDNHGYAYIFESENGHVIAHPDLAQLDSDPRQIHLLSACISELKTEGKHSGKTTFLKEDFFTAYTEYPDNGWTVGITLPMAEFFEHLESIKKTTITLIVLAMLTCSLLSYLLTLAIVRPLKELRKGIERVSGGNLDYYVDPPHMDIADALASSFNRMAASLKKSRGELKSTYIELAQKEKLAALGQMTAGIAHELKNPLGVILGSAQIVANTERPLAMREEAAFFIVDEALRLDKTLRAFLAFSKPTQPSFAPVDLVHLLDETLVTIGAQIAAAGIQIESSLDCPKIHCQADRDQIRQVFWNILINAMQAMPDGGILSVEAGCRVAPNKDKGILAPDQAIDPIHEVIIKIADNGCGIPENQAKRIFEPFISFRNGGIGLGLSIVHQILKLHQAEIEVESQKDRGTTFTLRFSCGE